MSPTLSPSPTSITLNPGKHLETADPNRPSSSSTPAAPRGPVDQKSTAASSNAAEEALTFTLPSGNTISYSIFGAPLESTPHPPTFYIHGHPSSRMEACFLGPSLSAANLSLVALDRPGFGLSTPVPARSVVDHARDVIALADHLQITRFAVLGCSGGGPYTLACAARIPTERLVSVGVAAGLGPYKLVLESDVWSKLWWVNKLGFLGPVHWPWIYGLMYPWVATFFVNRMKRLDYHKLVASPAFQKMPESDKEFVLQGGEEGVRGTVRTVEEATRQKDWARWHLLDAEVALVRHWGFQVGGSEGIKQEVRLWYGEKDAQTPLRLGERLRDELSNSRLYAMKGATHAGVMLQGTKIIKDLVGLEKWVEEHES